MKPLEFLKTYWHKATSNSMLGMWIVFMAVYCMFIVLLIPNNFIIILIPINIILMLFGWLIHMTNRKEAENIEEFRNYMEMKYANTKSKHK